MILFYLILLILAAVCFILSALNKPVATFNLLAFGLFFWVLVPTLQTFERLVK